jgi:hypothetical protein
MLLVRLMDGISSKNKAGTPFTTKLEYDLAVGSAVALKAGTPIYGKVQSSTQAGRALGKSTLDLRLTQVVVGGQPVPLARAVTNKPGKLLSLKRPRSCRGRGNRSIAGDAGMGAAIGATAGALVKGQTITVTPGTLLELTLMQPLTIKAPG